MNSEFVSVPRSGFEDIVHLLETMQSEIDSLISYAGGTGGYGANDSRIEEIRALLAQPAAKDKGEPVDRIQTLNLLNEALQSGGDWVFYVRPLIIKARDLLESKP